MSMPDFSTICSYFYF